MIPPDIDVRRASAKLVNVDLDRPIPDVSTDGHGYLFATAYSCGVPLGSIVVPAPIDPFPGILLADALSSFGADMHRRRLTERLKRPRPAASLPTATVIIATHNRPEELRRCLGSMRTLDYQPLEILVVENRTQHPDTRRVAEEAGATYLFEPLGGQARAHNRGLSVARGDIVLLTDDDCIVDRNWSRKLAECFDDPLVMLSAGLVLPARLDTAARWLCEKYSFFNRGFRSHVLDGSVCSALDAPRVVVGGCMAVRRRFVLSIGGFPEVLGPGMPLSGGGEEIYVGYRILRAGFKIAYDPAAITWHMHRADERGLRAAARDYAASGVTYALHMIFDNRDPLGAVGVLKMVRDVWGHVGFARRDRKWSRSLRVVVAEGWGLLRAPVSYMRSRRSARRFDPLVPVGVAEPAPWLDRSEEATTVVPASRPTVSVVIPTQGRRTSLLAMLHALDDQSYPRELLEVVVSVDGPAERVARMLRSARLQRIPRIVEGQADGAGVARNRGAEHATGELLLFFDDDVLPMHERVIEEHVRAQLLGEPGCVVGPVLPDAPPKRLRAAQGERNWWVDHAERLRSEPIAHTDVVTPNLSVPRDVFMKLGGFAEIYPAEDWEFGYRLLSAGLPLRAANAAGVVHRLSMEAPRELDDRRREGRAHVAFMQLHPRSYWSLGLVRWEEMTLRRKRAVRAMMFARRYAGAVVVAPLIVAALRIGGTVQRGLERVGSHRRSMTLLQRLSWTAYWSAVAEAVGDYQSWLTLLSRAHLDPGPSAVLDLAAPKWDELGAPGSSEVEVTFASARIGRAPLYWGGVPWSEKTFADNIVSRLWGRAVGAEIGGR